MLGIKRYVFKENLNNLEEAKKRQQKFRIASYVVLGLYYATAVIVGLLALRLLGATGRVHSYVDSFL